MKSYDHHHDYLLRTLRCYRKVICRMPTRLGHGLGKGCVIGWGSQLSQPVAERREIRSHLERRVMKPASRSDSGPGHALEVADNLMGEFTADPLAKATS